MGTAVCTGVTTITAILLLVFGDHRKHIYPRFRVSNLAVSLVFLQPFFNYPTVYKWGLLERLEV